VPFKHGDDLCLSFWAEAWDAKVVSFPKGAAVLEIGCAEADWQTPMLKERPDLRIYGIDWRDCQRPGHVFKGDVITYEFPPGSFEAIVSVSATEHIGLGSYNNDPLDADGDTKSMLKAYRWLKPGGWMYLDVPYRPDGPYSVNSNFRAYDEAAIQSRLIVGGFVEKWRKVMGVRRGDGPYLALVLEKR
jgi:cyclopropane fatty-acyl-phospholipid synthase-like methyltransferase